MLTNFNIKVTQKVLHVLWQGVAEVSAFSQEEKITEVLLSAKLCARGANFSEQFVPGQQPEKVIDNKGSTQH